MSDKGLHCPRCHCRDLRNTGGTVAGVRSKIRYRVCRNCGQRVRTKETILNAPETPSVPVSEDSEQPGKENGVLVFPARGAHSENESHGHRRRNRRIQS